MKRILVATVMGLMLASAVRAAEDWPKWLGPRGDGISKETGLLDKWPDDGPKKLWSVNVGKGYSSPIAVDGKLYLMSLVGNKDVLTCFDPDTGKVVWEESYDGGYSAAYPGTRATPTIADGRIYTYGGNGQLVCRELATGKQLWLTSVMEQTSAKNLTWGLASAPLLYNNRLYVQSGNGQAVCVAVDKDTGKIVWKSEPGLGGYAHPIVADVAGTKQLVVFGGNAIYVMDPETGKTLWKQPWVTKYDVNAATPLYHDGHVFLTSNYDRGCIMLKLSPAGVEKLWENKAVMSRFQPVILDRGYMYANSEGTIKCLQWPSGQIAWQSDNRDLRLGFGGSMVRVGDMMITLSDRGKLSLCKATPQGIELISQVQRVVEGNEVWSTPLIYRGKLYVKGATELVCLDISGK